MTEPSTFIARAWSSDKWEVPSLPSLPVTAGSTCIVCAQPCDPRFNPHPGHGPVAGSTFVVAST